MSHEFFSLGRHRVRWGHHLSVVGEIHHTQEPVTDPQKVRIVLARMKNPLAGVHISEFLKTEGKIPGRIEVLDIVGRMDFDLIKSVLFGIKAPVSEINIACLGSFIINGGKKEGLVYCMYDSGSVDIKRFVADDAKSSLPTEWFFPAIDLQP